MSPTFERPGSKIPPGQPDMAKLRELANKRRIADTPNIVRNFGRQFLGKFLLRDELSIVFETGPLVGADYANPEQCEAAKRGAADGWLASRGSGEISGLTPEEEAKVDAMAIQILEQNR